MLLLLQCVPLLPPRALPLLNLLLLPHHHLCSVHLRIPRHPSAPPLLSLPVVLPPVHLLVQALTPSALLRLLVLMLVLHQFPPQPPQKNLVPPLQHLYLLPHLLLLLLLTLLPIQLVLLVLALTLALALTLVQMLQLPLQTLVPARPF